MPDIYDCRLPIADFAGEPPALLSRRRGTQDEIYPGKSG
jgi:hypothetical protein